MTTITDAVLAKIRNARLALENDVWIPDVISLLSDAERLILTSNRPEDAK